jgi:hypothetical protein
LKALSAAEPGPVATERLVSLMQKESVDRFGTPQRWTELTKPIPLQRADTQHGQCRLAYFRFSWPPFRFLRYLIFCVTSFA